MSRFGTNVERTLAHVPTWSLQKADWEKYATLSIEYLQATPEGTDLSVVVEEFSNAIIQAAKRSIPISKPRQQKRMVPWWNDNCTRATRRKRAAYLKMKRSFRANDVIEFKKRRAEARKVVLQTKQAYWRNFCDSLNVNSNISKVWNVVKSMNHTRTWSSIKALKQNDEVLTRPKSIANCLAERFSMISSDQNYSPHFITRKSSSSEVHSMLRFEENCNDPINAPFSMSELQTVLKGRKGSSPGPDNISYTMIEKLPFRVHE